MQTTFVRFGRTVNLAMPATDLPAATIKYLIDYGWKQSLSDSFAAAKDAEEFEGKLLARFDKLIAGTMSEPRTGGTRTTDPIEREFKKLLAAKVLEWHAERKAAKKPKASEELTEIWVNNVLDTDALRETARENVERFNAIPVAEFTDEELLGMVEEKA